MLVLALQFSRGTEGTHRGTRRARRERRRQVVLRLLQNGREDRYVDRTDERGETYDLAGRTTNPPVHQLGVQTPGDLEVTDGVEWTP
jgi:hypothetical protein